MPNAHGSPIWYELLTTDPQGAKAFYDAVIGWNIGPQPPGERDYRMIVTADGSNVGGMMPLSREMVAGGARATWMIYIGVENVDAAVEKVTAAGGSVQMPAFDIPDVGRLAMVADPQGNPFYVMRGASEENSTAWERMGMGKCNWNELSTADPEAARAFYAEVFGWTYPGKMEMPGDLGDYVFVEVAGETIGATMKTSETQPPGWLFYFRAPDIAAASEAVKAGGGTVLQQPMEVPGGDMVLVARDPHGVPFGIAAPAKAG